MTSALYFGSFNPLHYGHLSIAEYLLDHQMVDQVRLILSPENPLKDPNSLANAYVRLDIIKLAIEKMEKIVVSTVEFHLPRPLYTINTLRYLRDQEPDTHFVLIIGADNIEILEEWHDWENLLKEFEIWVYPRKGYKGKECCVKYAQMPGTKLLKFLEDAPLFDISSTMIREGKIN